jgi:hypothetical protein
MAEWQELMLIYALLVSCVRSWSSGDEVVVVIKKARPIAANVGANSLAAANKGKRIIPSIHLSASH